MRTSSRCLNRPPLSVTPPSTVGTRSLFSKVSRSACGEHVLSPSTGPPVDLAREHTGNAATNAATSAASGFSGWFLEESTNARNKDVSCPVIDKRISELEKNSEKANYKREASRHQAISMPTVEAPSINTSSNRGKTPVVSEHRVL